MKNFILPLLVVIALMASSCKAVKTGSESKYLDKVNSLISGDTLVVSKKIGTGTVTMNDGTLVFKLDIRLPQKVREVKRILLFIYQLLPDDQKTNETEFINRLIGGDVIAYNKKEIRGSVAINNTSLLISLGINAKKTGIDKLALMLYLFYPK